MTEKIDDKTRTELDGSANAHLQDGAAMVE